MVKSGAEYGFIVEKKRECCEKKNGGGSWVHDEVRECAQILSEGSDSYIPLIEIFLELELDLHIAQRTIF